MIEPEAIEWIKKHHRFTNYMSASMLYLQDNFLLEEKLKKEHIKSRILGHWGTVPGLNLIYASLNYLISKTNHETLLIVGPGHGAPAVLSNLYLEETLKSFYPNATLDRSGLEYMIKSFSWPGGFPSHTYPGVPGTIHEGGELGYSLGSAYGAVFDNPNLLVACVVGDGEAETGPLAASWHSNKFLNPKNSGSVLPILHLNNYKISGPTILGSMSDEELRMYFTGLGYRPIFVNQYQSDDVYTEFLEATMDGYNDILDIKESWTGKESSHPRYPVIIFRNKKGWTGPKSCDGKKIEDYNLSHGIPLRHPVENPAELKCLEEWLSSYRIQELINKDGSPKKEVLEYIPKKENRIGNNKHAYGGRSELALPNLDTECVEFVERGHTPDSSMEEVGNYLATIIKNNKDSKNFRVFSPDESESNMLEPVFTQTDRIYTWPVRDFDEFIDKDGRMMEILSEHVLQEWMQGYNITGRHSVFISYEAFFTIITSMIDQYMKYLKQSLKFQWRKPLPSMNYISTSTGWRQDHNGFTHQNPSLINTLLMKHSDLVSVYLPADANILLASLEESLSQTNRVNLLIAGKRDIPQWLSMDEAREHVKRGISIWDWAGNTKSDEEPDVVLASAGDYQTIETIAAAQILKEEIPELKVRYVNVNELTSIGMADESNPVLTDKDFAKYFTGDKNIIFNFHGYPEAIKQLTWSRKISERMTILGYIEEGTTTTPFDMQVLNRASRYHVAMEAIMCGCLVNKKVEAKKEKLIQKISKILEKHDKYIQENGDDLPEVKNFQFKF